MERITLFMNFYDLDSKNSQDVYLQSLIVKEDVKRRTKSSTTSSTPKRKTSYRYNVKMPETSLEVCKLAFQNIFDVTPEQIRRLHKLLVKNELPKD